MTKIRATLFLTAAVVGSVTSGCQKSENTNQGANTIIATQAPAANTKSTEPVDLTGYSLATPSDSYKTALDSRKRCDIPVMKRVMSEAMIDALTERGASNPGGKKTLDEMVRMLCEMPQAPNGAIKDEKMVGDEATVKYQDEKGTWRIMDFQRENGEWKLTLPRGKSELPALK